MTSQNAAKQVDIAIAVDQANHLRHQRQFDSVSEIASTLDFNLNQVPGGSEDDLYNRNVSHFAGNRGEHEFRTYLLNEKSVASSCPSKI